MPAQTRSLVLLHAALVAAVATACGGAPGGESSSAVAGAGKVLTPAEGYVAVPGGYAHGSCVHALAEGETMRHGVNGYAVLDSSGATVREYDECLYPRIADPSHASREVGDTLPGPSGRGNWIEATVQSLPTGATSWTLYQGTIHVPPAPTLSNSTLTMYYFGSFDDGQGHILQPVLAWGQSAAGGGQFWSFAAFSVYSDGSFVTSPMLPVGAGDTIATWIQTTGATTNCPSGTNCQWDFAYSVGGADTTNETYSEATFEDAPPHGNFMNSLHTTAYEAYEQNNCAQPVTFSGITIAADGPVGPRAHANHLFEVPVTYAPVFVGFPQDTRPACFFGSDTTGTTTQLF